MDNSTLINQLADEVDNLFHIYQGLAGHIQDGSPAITRLRSQEVRQLGTTVQRMQAYIETLACRLRDQSKGVAHEPWILHTRVQPRVLISASLQKIVSKYHLEGQHEIWVNPSGTVLDPFERPVGISTGEFRRTPISKRICEGKPRCLLPRSILGDTDWYGRKS
jgi:hypothetical protein